MLSNHRIIKATATMLALGATASPAATARSIVAGPNPSGTAMAYAQQLKVSKYHALYRNVTAAQLASNLTKAPVYSRQDKQLTPSGFARPIVVSPAAHQSNPSSGGSTSAWTYAGIGAGGFVVVLLLGGALGATQRRTRPPAVATS